MKIQHMVRLKDQSPLNIDPLKSALLVIDVQLYFARPDDPSSQKGQWLSSVPSTSFARPRSPSQ